MLLLMFVAEKVLLLLVISLTDEGMQQSAIVGRMGLTPATVNRILQRHAATGTFVPGKSSGVPRKTTPAQNHTKRQHHAKNKVCLTRFTTITIQ